jgi:PAS domain S-box-containing protein
MTQTDLQLQGFSDPQLAVHAAGALPAWLWSADGCRVLWANPIGAKALGATNAVALAARRFGPADAHRRQVAQLARRLPENGSVRLERLRGFGAPLGMLATCGCARIDLPDGSHAVLITTTDTGARPMPLLERLQRLVEDSEATLVAFTREGMFAGASASGRRLYGLRDLAELGLADARDAALANGRTEVHLGLGRAYLYRVGSGNQVGLVAVLMLGTTAGPHPMPLATADQTPTAVPASPQESRSSASQSNESPVGMPAPNEPVSEDAASAATDEAQSAVPAYEAPASSNEAPAEFLLVGEDAATKPSAAAELCSDQPAERNLETAAAGLDDRATIAPDAPLEVAAAEPSQSGRRHPLRFMWQMDADGTFSVSSDEFRRLIGAQTAAILGLPWQTIADTLRLDPEGQIRTAIENRETWSGVAVSWPVDGGERLAVELAGLPIIEESRRFTGYRGFGVCRDLDALEQIDALRRAESHDADNAAAPAVNLIPTQSDHPVAIATPPATESVSQSARDTEVSIEAPGNVVPFRSTGETRFSALTPVENSAFHELARQLSARLEGETREPVSDATAPVIETESTSLVTDPVHEPRTARPAAGGSAHVDDAHPGDGQPDWLALEEPPARGDSRRDRLLFDLLPTGVLIYRLDRLLYANTAFLAQMGYADLAALEQAGGLDALYVEPGVSSSSSTSEAGTPVTISAADGSSSAGLAAAARLFTITWDGDNAHALIFSPAAAETSAAAPPAPPSLPVAPLPSPVVAVPAPGHADAEDLAAILDVTAEGIVMFDAGGNIHACNRSAEALFGYDGTELVRRNLTELFAPESTRLVVDYLESVRDAGAASVLDQGREALGKVSQGGIIPLSMTIGRTRADGPNFFAVFRDLSQTRRGESELLQARRLADRSANAKADMLARISHEVRAPLSAIIGFAEVMIGERFGALGNERYAEYLRDIRTSGERVIALINDLVELSRIETGKLELAFANQNLNELVESCVVVMQPQANRERIIIRTSLSHALPPVVADARALRQIALNLISTSISLANAGGQVIVSTALSDFGEVVLRVRDTGHGLNDQEVAAALEPFRSQGPSEQASDSSGLSLSLTKALVEANRAQFHIKAASKSGTLIEVVFSRAMARNQSLG